MDELKYPEFCLYVMGKSQDPKNVKELFEESTEFLVGNEIKIAVHKIQVQKVADLVLSVKVIPWVV